MEKEWSYFFSLNHRTNFFLLQITNMSLRVTFAAHHSRHEKIEASFLAYKCCCNTLTFAITHVNEVSECIMVMNEVYRQKVVKDGLQNHLNSRTTFSSSPVVTHFTYHLCKLNKKNATVDCIFALISNVDETIHGIFLHIRPFRNLGSVASNGNVDIDRMISNSTNCKYFLNSETWS